MTIIPGSTNHSSPNVDHHVLNFYQFLHTHQLPGAQLGWDESDGNLKFIDCSFIPLDALRSHFQDRERLYSLLQDVFSPSEPPVHEETIYSSCLRLFCVLAVIGRGHFLEHCLENGILDSRLPVTSIPPELEHLTVLDKEFWPAFQKEQWRFFPHHFDINQISITYPDHLIFPIASWTPINVSCGRTITKITIHPGYHNLRPSGSYGEEMGAHELNTFVLKSLDRTDVKNLQCYDSEVKAFRRLGSNGLANAQRKPPKEIIRFFGSFKQTQLYHILLEYADIGTLQHYFESTPRPTNRQDLLDFWKSMMAIAIGLSRIHQLLPEDGRIGVFQGYHQDIKLSNILVFSVDPTSRYKVGFKIADLGLSNFVQGQYYVSNASGRGRPGTRTFGSPESHQARSLSNGVFNYGQHSDVWSLACIFSVAATWAIGDWSLVEQYTQKRRQQRKEWELSPSDCFHDDKVVLDVVRDWHTFLANESADYDTITPELWTELLEPALDTVPHRIDALKFQMAATDLFTSKKFKRGSKASSAFVEPADAPGQEMIFHQSPTLHSLETLHNRRERPPRGISIAALEQIEPSFSYSTPVFQPSSREPENIGSLSSPAALNFSTVSDSSTNSGANIRSSVTRSNPSNVLPSSGNTFGVQVHDTPDSSQIDSHPGQQSFLQGHDINDSSNGPQDLSEVAHGKMRCLDVWDNTNCPFHSRQKHSIDTMSRANLAAWYVAQQKNKNYNIPHAALEQNLRHRDFVFLLEDSTSMRQYWNDVCELFSHMTKFIEKHDKDGVELYFTNCVEQFREKDTRALAERAKRMETSLNASSEPAFTLRRIWESHSNGIRHGKRLRFFKRKQRIALTICIFTDGIWRGGAGSRIEKLLREIVEFLDVNNCTDGHVGIQFIQFGDGEAETMQLAKLDKGLKKKFGRDIVDVEPSSGNVWKMFLGTILDSFDDDLDEERCTCHSMNGRT